MLFFSSTLLGEASDVTNDFDGATSIVKSGILLSSQTGVSSFLSDVGLLSALRVS